jgi:hypothetical protein
MFNCYCLLLYQVDAEFSVAVVHVVKLGVDGNWIVVAEMEVLKKNQ